MNLQNEPKTVEDYKDVVKILKLKIIKQNKRIQELQLKNKTYQEQINGVTLRGQDVQMSSRVMHQLENETKLKKQLRQLQMSTLKGKVEVMSTYAKGLKKLGISPESVFRISDFAYKNYVQSDYFREIIVKIKLDLTQKEISCLIFIFDETYSGMITRQDYCNTLQAYKIEVQGSHHQFIHQCIFKLSQIFHNEKVNLIKYYEQMQSRSKSKVGSTNKKIVDLNVFQQQIKKTYGSIISQRETIASFNAIDLQSQGYLQKNNFLYTITSYINKLLTAQQNHSKKSHFQWSNSKSNLTQQLYSGTPKKVDKVVQNFNQTSKITEFANEATSSNTQNLASKMQKQFGVSLNQVYDQLMSYDFANRLTLKTFKKLCSKLKLTSQFVNCLYKDIDVQFKGSLFLNQLINYYLAHSNDNQMILHLFGRYFQVSDLDSEKFWFMFGLTQDSEISKNRFIQILNKTFQTKDQKSWQNFWLLFDKGRGSCNVGSIIKTIKKYQS